MVSVDQWGDIVERVAGPCGDVTTVIDGSTGDPHSFEPSPADLAAFDEAELVVRNGLGYDTWAVKAVDALGQEPVVVDAGDVAGRRQGDNPHLWYDPTIVRAVADAVADELVALRPDAAADLAASRAGFEQELARYEAEVAAVRGVANGRSFGATEPVFDLMAAALGLADGTPEGYRRAAANESEPGPADLADFDTALTGGAMEVLVYNAQTEGPGPERLRSVARSAGVPVVEVTETMAPGARSFFDWQTAQLRSLREALAG